MRQKILFLAGAIFGAELTIALTILALAFALGGCAASRALYDACRDGLCR